MDSTFTAKIGEKFMDSLVTNAHSVGSPAMATATTTMDPASTSIRNRANMVDIRALHHGTVADNQAVFIPITSG